MAEEKNIVEYRARDGQDIRLTPEIIKKFLVSGHPEYVTMQEMYYYMGVCKSRGMNPFIKDCYLIKYTEKDPAAIITSIDYYRKRARAKEDCAGWTAGVIVKTTDGKIKHSHGLVLEGEKVLGGWFEATPKGWATPFRKEVNLKGYIKKTSEGKITRFWSEENQPSQIAKVAEAQGLRAIWGDEFQGLYVDAEIQSQDAQAEFDTIFASALVPESTAKAEMPDELELQQKIKDITPGIDFDQVHKFIQLNAERNKITYTKALYESLKDQKKFLQFLNAWIKKQAKPQVPTPPPPEPKPEQKEEPKAEPKSTPFDEMWNAEDTIPDSISTFVDDLKFVIETLPSKVYNTEARLFGVMGKTPEEIDKEFTLQDKRNFLTKLKSKLDEVNGGN